MALPILLCYTVYHEQCIPNPLYFVRLGKPSNSIRKPKWVDILGVLLLGSPSGILQFFLAKGKGTKNPLRIWNTSFAPPCWHL